MISQVRFSKQKIIGGNLLKNAYDKLKNVISFGSKILNRIPSGIKSEIKTKLKNVAIKAVNSKPVLLKLIT